MITKDPTLPNPYTLWRRYVIPLKLDNEVSSAELIALLSEHRLVKVTHYLTTDKENLRCIIPENLTINQVETILKSYLKRSFFWRFWYKRKAVQALN